ncbi:hypothetical protein C8F04DRAFT_1184810 [Mycena alexandri]|uniref:Uncharacterized protein n=1 Tax=Mycena alexandri TaxID=1745969 RepID=A0AAD6SRB6_9AGAR|nr:hypothetical protein C8F04DRAFT_1184810 [Mycena alexandri]
MGQMGSWRDVNVSLIVSPARRGGVVESVRRDMQIRVGLVSLQRQLANICQSNVKENKSQIGIEKEGFHPENCGEYYDSWEIDEPGHGQVTAKFEQEIPGVVDVGLPLSLNGWPAERLRLKGSDRYSRAAADRTSPSKIVLLLPPLLTPQWRKTPLSL